MIGSLYSGISGLKANTDRMAVIGDNIANSNTTAYKSTEISFANMVNRSAGGYTGNEIGSGVVMSDVHYNWMQGTVERTSNPYDVAITGSGFIKVGDPFDDTRFYYTRAGAFKFNAAGELVNSDGMKVQGYLIAPGADPAKTTLETIKIPKDGETFYTNVTVDNNGVYSGFDSSGSRVKFAQLAVCDVVDKSAMAKMGQNLYTVDPSLVLDDLPGAKGMGNINPGAVELSNVDLAKEFVNMITAQRSFSANSKVITTSDEILQELVNLKR